MELIKKILEVLVRIFFRVSFFIFGRPKKSTDLQKAIALYQGDGFAEAFAEIRAWDAPYGELNKLVPKSGRVLDLGCGDGLLANYLALASPKRKVVGVELNLNRIAKADKGLVNTTFKQGDILKMKLTRTPTVILAHVLHHLPSRNDQERLLTKISKALKKKDQILILEIDRKPLAKYLFSLITDAIIVPILFEGRFFSSQFFYRRVDDWKNLLRSLDFDVQTRSVHQGMPFSHVLIKATKK